MYWELVVIFGVVVGAVGAFIGLMVWLASASCYANMEMGGLKGTWGPLVGCQVQIEEGHYIPYGRWRGMEEIKLRRQ